jgi:tetratricopeptide (TPR) repeat protein
VNGFSGPAVLVGLGTREICMAGILYSAGRPWRQVAHVLSMGLILLTLFAPSAAAQAQQSDWQLQVRKYCDASDWPSAVRVLEQQIARAPNDLDLKAWRARVLGWSGNLAAAQQEYLAILAVSPNDPDVWAGLANVYAREGRKRDAVLALDRAVQLDSKRADLRTARARAMREAGDRSAARAEFAKALSLDSASTEARAGLRSLRGEPKNELRVGYETDFLSYSAANQGSFANLATRWTPQLGTSVGFGEYHRGGVFAEKYTGSTTGHVSWLGALTAGGAIGHDNSVIPRSEAFFDLDRGWKTGEGTVIHGFEFDYGQHWYWYQAARILTLNGTAVIYLPRDWSFSLAATGARSAFSGTGTEWRPSGSTRLVFPLAAWKASQLSGNIFFAAGTENFASADQIGRFASQTYGGGLRFRFAERQDIACTASHQRRTQNRTDTYLGISYGIHF